MPICRLCLSSVGTLVKSHIYPRALNQRVGQPPSMLAVIGREVRPQKSPTGIYERFLCQVCEALFSSWDRHFVEFVREIEKGDRLLDPRTGECMAWTFPENLANPAQLRLFANSLLLRAHLVPHPFFQGVGLGPFYERLKALVLSGDPGGVDEFAVVLVRQDGVTGQMAHNATTTKVGEVRAYWFAPPGLRLVIKVDQRPFPNFVRDLQLGEGRPVLAIRRLEAQQDLDDVRQMTDPFRASISRILKRVP